PPGAAVLSRDPGGPRRRHHAEPCGNLHRGARLALALPDSLRRHVSAAVAVECLWVGGVYVAARRALVADAQHQRAGCDLWLVRVARQRRGLSSGVNRRLGATRDAGGAFTG